MRVAGGVEDDDAADEGAQPHQVPEFHKPAYRDQKKKLVKTMMELGGKRKYLYQIKSFRCQIILGAFHMTSSLF